MILMCIHQGSITYFKAHAGQIENMMRLICKQYDILPDKNNPSFWDYYQKININKILEMQKVLFKRTKKILEPFIIETKYSPNWWKKYNDTKHNLPDRIIEGNMGNTIKAVSALYALHHMSHFLSAPLDALQNNDSWQDSRVTGNEDPILFSAITSEDRRLFDSEIFYAITRYCGKQ